MQVVGFKTRKDMLNGSDDWVELGQVSSVKELDELTKRNDRSDSPHKGLLFISGTEQLTYVDARRRLQQII